MMIGAKLLCRMQLSLTLENGVLCINLPSFVVVSLPSSLTAIVASVW